MLINFCHARMCPTIKCDKPFHDDFPPKNLVIDADSLGFISESFVKPPVNVEIQFPCNIIISKIIIDPCVGHQMTRKLELATGTERVHVTSSWMSADTNDTQSLQLKNPPRRIGSINMFDPGVVCFENPGFYTSPPFTKDILSQAGNVKSQSFLGSRHPSSLNHVSRLILRLQQAGPTGVVALKRVEVWGQPSMRHRPDFAACLNRFTGSTSTLQQPLHNPPGSKPDKSAKEQAPTGEGQVPEEDLPEIPEDFLDALTCELMTVPMRLPSGKNVDQSSLDRHCIEEAAKAKQPNDPFTGVPYTPDRKPVFNPYLKARIDAFLSKYSHCRNVQNLPRTVQTFSHSSVSVWRPIGKRGPSALTEPPIERKKSRLMDSDCGTSTNVSPQGTSSSASDHTPSPTQTNSREHSPDKRNISKFNSQFNSSSKATSFASQHTPNPVQTDSREETPDPGCLVIDLDSSPSKESNPSLNADASFTSSSDGGKERRNSVCCSCDGSDLHERDYFYCLPCKHIICRQCLLGRERQTDEVKKCGQCGFFYTNTQVYRIH